MNLLPDTYHIQQNFSKYCRTGKKVNLPGIATDRLKHYRRLVFNVIRDSMESAFPIAYNNIPTRKWDKMLQDFFSNHACQSYQMWKLPLEFYTYAVEHNWEEVYELPYLNDLLSFEWAEMEVYNMADILPAPFQLEGNWLEDTLVLNPEIQLLALAYPVHLIAPVKELIAKKGTYYVLVYRIPENGDVQFIDLSPWLAFTIEQLSQGNTLAELLAYAPSLNISDIAQLEKDTLAFLQQMQQQQVVMGFSVI
jgi:hypothetical protein